MTDPNDYDEVLAENARLKAVQPVGQKATLFVVATLVIAALTVISIVALTVLRPEANNTPAISTILGVVTPILVAMVAAAVQQVHLAVNSRLSQLLELTAAESKARGALKERDRGAAVAEEKLAQRAAPIAAPVPVTIVSPDPLPVKIEPQKK